LKKVQRVLRYQRQTTTEVYVEGSYTDTKKVIRLFEIKNLKNFSENSRKTKKGTGRKKLTL
jgi:hypothetical protein